jgi:hypothetical protein
VNAGQRFWPGAPVPPVTRATSGTPKAS